MRGEGFRQAAGGQAAMPPHPRFFVYRRNIDAALVNALRVRFPAVEGLLGRQRFAEIATSFATANRPRSPVLIHYGSGFADHLARCAEEAAPPCSADVARADDLWWRAYHAAEVEPVPAQDFAAIGEDCLYDTRFRFHPSVAVMQSSFAVGALWQASRSGRSFDGDAAAPQAILVARPRTQVDVSIIAPARHDFLRLLIDGAALGKACEDVAMRHPDFDMGAQLLSLITMELVTGY